ncbi:MAG TPA: rhodanese-like domain-containing protein [Stellaceae bacterium]|nr:rhodanese-like domain-containing protein [Stellaceae bacterium]
MTVAETGEAAERLPAKARFVAARTLRAMHDDGTELAIIDVREELLFSQNHLLHARSVPLSRIELLIAPLVPRRSTRIVLCDDNDGAATRAAAILDNAGYSDVSILEGGCVAWQEAGFELFSGVNVPSKAFGEFIEHASYTPSIAAEELARLMHDGRDLVVLDSRPFDEYFRVSIPTATSVPGAELVLRARDAAPSPETTIVVNCAGRTRSIIGAQSLINAGIPNKIVALRNGTMGWSLAGYTCDAGKERRAPAVSTAGLAAAREAAAQVAHRFGIKHIDLATLEGWRTESAQRTLYMFDVRDPAEYAAGHLAGAISAPGGQLVQATDQYVGTLGARIVLVDDLDVRAVMTASWLMQMGWNEVFVLAESGAETGCSAPVVLARAERPELAIESAELAPLLAAAKATIIDLSLSRNFRRGHIAGAWFAIRSRFARALPKIRVRDLLVLTSEDGIAAALAASEAEALVDVPVRVLTGGNAAWTRAGHALTGGDENMADEPVDVWLKPYERASNTTNAMAEYLAWEVDLLPRIARDGTCHFRKFPTAVRQT